ncbi:MAG: rhodanese-like domain-containing protein [Nevskia sp.]|uniref:rhodanese-like domain-containing protein n=1 Tax=Nevskia sp. TaxID=1929292 RepID=UPI004036311E
MTAKEEEKALVTSNLAAAVSPLTGLQWLHLDLLSDYKVVAALLPLLAQMPSLHTLILEGRDVEGDVQLDALLARPDQLLLIDVRRPEEVASKGRFPVFLNIQASELADSLKFIPKDRALVTVSNHAGRAGAAGDLLAAKGFKVAGAIGVANYLEQGGHWALAATAEQAAAAPATR